ncbi:hypothetical protein ACPBEH_05010 [Latilactobacillus sp. 5-91]|uniref:hypothetical protein n=1 Tax=Latilactobacillus sp. 5-91 TaxID=3410924 RepID=UPI003C78CE79
MKLKQTINLLARSVAALDAKSGLLVSRQNPGLASPEMKRQLESLFDHRIELNDKNTDVNNLPPGNYVGGSNLVNAPITQMGNEFFIDVSVAKNGDRIMYATNVPTGSSWKKVIAHGDTSGLYYPRNWTKVTTETVLWSGMGDVAVGQTLKLIDKWSFYDGLIITYNLNGAIGSVRMQVPRSDFPTGVPSQMYFVGLNVSNTLSENAVNVDIAEGYLEKVDESNLKLGSFNHIIANLAKGTAQYNVGQGSFQINNILGVR